MLDMGCFAGLLGVPWEKIFFMFHMDGTSSVNRLVDNHVNRLVDNHANKLQQFCLPTFCSPGSTIFLSLLHSLFHLFYKVVSTVIQRPFPAMSTLTGQPNQNTPPPLCLPSLVFFFSSPQKFENRKHY